MNELSNEPRALAMVLDGDPDVAAVLSWQLRVLGMESRYYRQADPLLAELVRRPPQLVVMALEFGDEDGIALLRGLADAEYAGRVLLLSGVERKISRIAERVGHTLGLQMIGSLDKPMRLADLRRRLGRPSVGREAPGGAAEDPMFGVEELERAIVGGELTLYYQPQFDLASGRLSGVEALVRWSHPRLGLLGPASFLPLLSAEQGKHLTRFVLARSMVDADRWRRQGLGLSMSVNVTADDLMCPELPALIRRPGGESPPVVLEVTETQAMDDELLGSEVAARLHLAGLEVSVDDFGVGFSSLSRLQMLPISELKIDRSFVSRLHEESQDAAIVEAVALLGRRLGIRVVAEGVEELAILPLLERFGCTHVQGFGLSRPVPAELIPGLARLQLPSRSSIAASGASLGSTP